MENDKISSSSEMDFAQKLLDNPNAQPAPKKKPAIEAPKSKELLFKEMMTHEGYAGVIDLIMRFQKSRKGTPADMIELLSFIKAQLVAQIEGIPAQQPRAAVMKLLAEEKDSGSMLVELHFNLLSAIQLKKKAPSYMAKSVLISLEQIKFDRNEYRERAVQILKIVRPNCYQLMTEIFSLGRETFISLVAQKMEEQKYRDVVQILTLFPDIHIESQGDFDAAEMSIRHFLMERLLRNDISAAKLLAENMSDKIHLIQSQYARARNTTQAAKLIKEFGLDLETIDQLFYEIEDTVILESMNFYMTQFGVSFKHYSMQNVLRLADYLVDHGSQGYGKPLAYFIEQLVKHDNLDEAKHIFTQHKALVEKSLSKHLKEIISDVVIELEVEDIKDDFGPVSQSATSIQYLSLPKDLKVFLVDSESEIAKLDLFAQTAEADEPLGIDSEWRPSINVFHQSQGPSIIQISDSKTCIILDILALKASKSLCAKLQSIFQERIIIGFGFQTDIAQIKEFLSEQPLGATFERITRFIDLQEVFQKTLKMENPPRLQYVVNYGHRNGKCFDVPEEVFLSICKIEQMSNWERRPLRRSQIHYAALDAYVLNQVTMALNLMKDFAGFKIEEFYTDINYTNNEKN